MDCWEPLWRILEGLGPASGIVLEGLARVWGPFWSVFGRFRAPLESLDPWRRPTEAKGSPLRGFKWFPKEPKGKLEASKRKAKGAKNMS